MSGLKQCTIVLEFNYGEPSAKTSLGSVWLFEGDGRHVFEEEESELSDLQGWIRVAGPIDFDLADNISSNLRKFLESCGVLVIEETVTD